MHNLALYPEWFHQSKETLRVIFQVKQCRFKIHKFSDHAFTKWFVRLCVCASVGKGFVKLKNYL